MKCSAIQGESVTTEHATTVQSSTPLQRQKSGDTVSIRQSLHQQQAAICQTIPHLDAALVVL